MFKITIHQRLKKLVTKNTSREIHSDDTLAFTEQRPARNEGGRGAAGDDAHALFNRFTADIIRENTKFTR